MITRKHLLLAIGATCLLTMFVITVVPIKSGSYDPSLDENHDGKIDGQDIALPALIYGTAGDPALNVVTTANYSQIKDSAVVYWNNYWLVQHPTAGFRKVTVCFYANLSEGGRYTSLPYSIQIGFIEGNGVSSYRADSFSDTAYEFSQLPLMQPEQYANCTTRTYDVTGPTMWICVWNTDLYEAMGITCFIYMTA